MQFHTAVGATCMRACLVLTDLGAHRSATRMHCGTKDVPEADPPCAIVCGFAIDFGPTLE
jgi:hypothetical protein